MTNDSFQVYQGCYGIATADLDIFALQVTGFLSSELPDNAAEDHSEGQSCGGCF